MDFMQNLTIINFGDIRTDKTFEDVLKQNYPFLEVMTTVEPDLMKLNDGQLDTFGLKKTLSRRGNRLTFLVVTPYALYEHDPESEKNLDLSGGCVSYPENKIAVVSPYDPWGGIDITRKSVHAVGVWYKLKRHGPNIGGALCPMIPPYYLGKGVKSKGDYLCEDCKSRLKPFYRKFKLAAAS